MHVLALVALAATNLIGRHGPVRTAGVNFAERLTDGVASHTGDPWSSALASVFQSTSAYAVWDLGETRPITAVWLQGDHNDSYEVATSLDGSTFSPLWTAPPVGARGMRARFVSGLDGTARFVRVRPVAGDGSYSLSELQIFSQTPAPFPPRIPERRGAPVEEWLHSGLLTFGLALLAFVTLARRGMRGWYVAALALLPTLAALLLARDLAAAWPFEQRTVSLMRGIVATVAGLTIAREVFAPRRWPAHRAAVISVLAVCGVVGVGAFYNLGQPQFFDLAQGRRTFVHVLDLRQYYLTAKYFPELGYRHLYEADVAAYLDDNPTVPIERIAGFTMRDLGTHEVSSVAEQRAAIEQVKQRFTPARWEALRRDERYFRNVMGTSEYFRYMIDYGGNATPVWILIARGLFSVAPASEAWFVATGLLDALLLLIAFVAIGRCFGARTMFVCMVVFGANDYIMYGSNWAGATLRHDWLAYLALGTCALRVRRFALGGALLGLATMIRAFPALALAGVALPAAWDLVRRRRGCYRDTLRVLAGGGVTILALFVVSAVLSPRGAWGDWLAKVHLLNAQGHASHVSLRSIFAGAEHQAALLTARVPVFAAAVAVYVILVILACRGKRPEQAALLGLSLVPVVFAPANYYIHFIFLLPLLGIESVGLVVLGLCAVQYWITWIGDFTLHFYLGSVLLMATILWILLTMLRREEWLLGWWATPPRASPSRTASVSSPAPSPSTACDPQASPSP